MGGYDVPGTVIGRLLVVCCWCWRGWEARVRCCSSLQWWWLRGGGPPRGGAQATTRGCEGVSAGMEGLLLA